MGEAQVGNPVADAIARYRSATPNDSGECPEKVDAVQALEAHFGDLGAAEFLLSVLREPSEYDLARVEVCRVLLGYGSRPVPRAAECAGALLAALSDQDEDLVRQWAARALVRVADVAGVEEALVARVLDVEENLDVRHNALSALRGRSLSEGATALLAQGTADAEMGWHIAQRIGRDPV